MPRAELESVRSDAASAAGEPGEADDDEQSYSSSISNLLAHRDERSGVRKFTRRPAVRPHVAGRLSYGENPARNPVLKPFARAHRSRRR